MNRRNVRPSAQTCNKNLPVDARGIINLRLVPCRFCDSCVACPKHYQLYPRRKSWCRMQWQWKSQAQGCNSLVLQPSKQNQTCWAQRLRSPICKSTINMSITNFLQRTVCVERCPQALYPNRSNTAMQAFRTSVASSDIFASRELWRQCKLLASGRCDSIVMAIMMLVQKQLPNRSNFKPNLRITWSGRPCFAC